MRAEEHDALETRLQTLRTEQRRRAEAKILGRVDICTSSAAGRVIEYVAQTSHQSEKFFENIGGVDSVASIRLQSKMLRARASLIEHETRRDEKANQKLETQKRRAQDKQQAKDTKEKLKVEKQSKLKKGRQLSLPLKPQVHP